MEKAKKWEEYSPKEKTDLLKHWFYYYGGTLISFQELEDFESLALTRQEEIFDLIMTSFLTQNTIQSNILVFCMRQNKVDELFKHIVRYNALPEEEQERLKNVRQVLTDEIVGTYLEPEPPVPMDVVITTVEKNPQKK